jgi:dCMP deaminase
MIREDKALKYLKLARIQSELFSKDPSTKVGCIILAPDSLQILTMGYNGFPRGIDEKDSSRWSRPTKNNYVVHAEMNALCNACRHGAPLENSIAIVTMFPCSHCSRCLIQSGIKHVVSVYPDMSSERWKNEFEVSISLLGEAEIGLTLFDASQI